MQPKPKEILRVQEQSLKGCDSVKSMRESMEPSLKDRASIVGQCLEHKDDKLRSRTRKHWSFICLEDTEAEPQQGQQKGQKDLKTLKKAEDRSNKATLDSDHKLLSKVIELSVVLQQSRTLPKQLQGEQILQKEVK
ncbi:Arf-GAP with Rho-GAP domain, ANK repeat and PH domain-containing protein 2 [Heterocephalus glaber]|uniref:Arf-GAP with Rho-GAP domain, ANK repeat and PH domain-containing protein 2 n=1 Tax=Heterocephalus glaber TaxID=10181 RepID=G5BFF9_HETGA|nr:Arf-GAP with Rho-GAP domain, ANK repeat and PH domain-containing protein 2 [Heterocephalus glaber]